MPRQISTALLRPGMILARSLYDGQGRVLLQKGVSLKDRYIDKIKDGYASIYIDDEISEGIEIPQVITEQLRFQMQQTLASEWDTIQRTLSVQRPTSSKLFAKSLRDQVKQMIQTVQHTTIIKEDLASLAGYDNVTYVHSMNVAIYSLLIGASLFLSDSMMLDLGLGALLHDIGKIFVPTEVLNKPDKLTADEYKLMQTHAELGHNFLAKQPELSYLIAHCAFQHHERLNGKGYPRGLRGDEIHLFGRIIAVADVYDAMIMHRPYRRGIVPSEAMEFLYSRADSEFDLKIVSLFSKRVAMFPIGSEVHLSDGRNAIVVELHENIPGRPVVRVFQDATGKEVAPYAIDLATQLNITILSSLDAAKRTLPGQLS
ncbi:HD-GYP domain-containing protein [Ferroacidibacillus organovorans]|uniref:Uncharacterized protein n=1 Tax=Ferroacidibacillus organovorans TaxID=1765683 RepID=A0A1V4EWR6_9BACL|nr:HD-GYP domain-containing protein [Ferroacidibacillus organovorans]OPG17292.1 hypothetical protein B2M26_02915 [Ferroacidibacillus organovorans]